MEDRINNIIAKSFSNEATEADLAQLDNWLAEDPENRVLFDELKMFWQEPDTLSATSFDADKAWQHVSARIATGHAAETPRRISFPAWAKYSLAAAAVLLIGLFVIRQTTGEDMITIAANDANMEVVLPDQSHVELRAGAVLHYPGRFDGKERHVTLEGEAFFEVTHDKKHPFVVAGQDVTIKVLGTSFNVQFEHSKANVNVLTGKVQMTRINDQAQFVILTPGEKGILTEEGLIEEMVVDSNFLYWKTGRLNFNGRSLEQVVHDLASFTGTNISLAATMPANTRGQLINISFNKQPPEEMLTELCLVAHCTWFKTTNGYVISSIDK